MSPRCESCGGDLEVGWIACPNCGRPVAPRGGSDKLVRVVTKVGIELLEAGLVEAQASAEEKGNATRAAQIALARNLAREVAPKIADAVATYLYQKEQIERGVATPRALPGGKAPRRD
jgi:hypothetical protein